MDNWNRFAIMIPEVIAKTLNSAISLFISWSIMVDQGPQESDPSLDPWTCINFFEERILSHDHVTPFVWSWILVLTTNWLLDIIQSGGSIYKGLHGFNYFRDPLSPFNKIRQSGWALAPID